MTRREPLWVFSNTNTAVRELFVFIPKYRLQSPRRFAPREGFPVAAAEVIDHPRSRRGPRRTLFATGDNQPAGLEMYHHILNARISGYERSFHLMADTVSFANRNGGINLHVQFDKQVCPAFSNWAFSIRRTPGWFAAAVQIGSRSNGDAAGSVAS